MRRSRSLRLPKREGTFLIWRRKNITGRMFPPLPKLADPVSHPWEQYIFHGCKTRLAWHHHPSLTLCQLDISTSKGVPQQSHPSLYIFFLDFYVLFSQYFSPTTFKTQILGYETRIAVKFSSAVRAPSVVSWLFGVISDKDQCIRGICSFMVKAFQMRNYNRIKSCQGFSPASAIVASIASVTDRMYIQ